MEPENLVWILLSIGNAILFVLPFALQKRANERIEQLTAELAIARQNERQASMMLASADRARVEAQAFAIAFREEQTRRDALAEQIAALVAKSAGPELPAPESAGPELPAALAAWCTKAAHIVLKTFPIADNEREVLAASATVGALLYLHAGFGTAINEYIASSAVDAPIYGARNDGDDELHDDGDDELHDGDDGGETLN